MIVLLSGGNIFAIKTFMSLNTFMHLLEVGHLVSLLLPANVSKVTFSHFTRLIRTIVMFSLDLR